MVARHGKTVKKEKPPADHLPGACMLFVVLAAGLNGFTAVQLLQNHDPGQVMWECHRTHGKLEICHLFDPWGHSEGRADQKAGAAFAG